MQIPIQSHFLEELCNPKSIAFYGANENLLQNMGSQQLLNLLDNGYKGSIYPIHPRLSSILGITAFSNINDLPEIPDLAIIVLPNRIIPQIFVELGEFKVRNIILVTAGFRETGNQDAENELKNIANKYGFHFIGPNCIGILNTHTKYSKYSDEECILNCTWVNYRTHPGNISIATQSGTFACHTNFFMVEKDIHMSKAISVGNEANIDLCDCLEYFDQDHTTDVILLYIEEIKRGRKFFELASRISARKPIIALYVGGSNGGAKAVASHTGSIAGNDLIYNGLFNQIGIIRVYTLEELFDTAMLFSKTIPKGIIPNGNRIAIITNSGGPGATMADKASRIGLKLPLFSASLQNQLSQYLPPTAQAKNPLDYTFSINPDVFFRKVPKIIAMSGEVDAIVIYGGYGPAFFSYHEIGNEFLANSDNQEKILLYLETLKNAIKRSRKLPKKYNIPIIFVNLLGLEDSVFMLLNSNGFPTYRMPHQAIIALNHLISYGIINERNQIS